MIAPSPRGYDIQMALREPIGVPHVGDYLSRERGRGPSRRQTPDELHAALQRARSELTRVRATEILDPQASRSRPAPNANQRKNQARAIQVNEARKQFLRVLDKTALGRASQATGDRRLRRDDR